ncbi:PREDICTED: putative defense protein 3 [Nicrophorus vespilloides]|uniref:Defense protein 3 n=1 Tax=Nicrophorus vespilloides TaxID=110193 RepID=A0ABM1MBY2_NICVS|nr:PREDICTED: putative defense protein 3 [Nicrophorus vespilloides]
MGRALVFVILGVVGLIEAFPDGAPVDACVRPNHANEPNHGRFSPQSAGTNPYQVIASSDTYGPGAQITVTIHGHDTFKGFLIQARDASTNEWIGSWLEVPNTKIHPECSAITHADPKDKQQAVLVWQAPQTAHGGHVYFTGTVLKSYSTFWSGVISKVGA